MGALSGQRKDMCQRQRARLIKQLRQKLLSPSRATIVGVCGDAGNLTDFFFAIGV